MIQVERIQNVLSEKEVDAVIATSAENVFYMSGFRGPLEPKRYSMWVEGQDCPDMILPNGDTDLLITNQLEFGEIYSYGDYYYYEGHDLSNREKEILELNFKNNSSDAIGALLDAIVNLVGQGKTIALESRNLMEEETRLIEKGSKCKITAAEGIFSELRKIKSEKEVERLEKSVAITEAAIEYSSRQVKPGMTEKDLEKIYKKRLIELGAEPGFCLIGFGPHSAESCIPSEIALKEGDIVLYDVGCSYKGYASDIARTFLFEYSDSEIEMKYDILKKGMDKEISLIKNGACTSDIFRETMRYIREEGAKKGIKNLSEFKRHHLGHGIGISTYDDPLITLEKNEIESGMVMCVEPPYYEIGVGGIQVEDEIVVTEKKVKRLSHAPDDMVIL
jgi:Xaa-Pro aminopeptidase